MNETTLIDRIKNKMREDAINATDLADYLSINKDRLYKWLSGKANPKTEDAEILKQWVDGNFSKEGSENSNQSEMSDLKRRILDGKTIEAIILLATANEKLADSNQKLTALLEKNRRAFTGGGEQEISPALTSMLQGLQEVVLRVAMGERFESVNEVAALLHKGSPDPSGKVNAPNHIQNS